MISGRPTTIGQVLEKLAHFRSPEAEAACQNFMASPDDVFISTYSKSGTTWMQQVVHQLRSGGDSDFDEISAVVPWLESAVDMGIDPRAPQPGPFRAFKCHLLYRDIPKGGRYITVFRDPASVLPSFYRFFEGWWFEPGSVSLADFAEHLYLRGSAAGRHWDHLLDWYPRHTASDTLVLCYEDMLSAPEKVPGVVADFLGLSLDDRAMQTVISHSSRDYMLNNKSRFDEHLLRQHRDAIWGLPAGGSANKVAAQKSTVVLSPAIQQGLAALWQETIEAALGFKDYKAFRRSLPNPLAAKR